MRVVFISAECFSITLAEDLLLELTEDARMTGATDMEENALRNL
jgi:hypothetical protein